MTTLIANLAIQGAIAAILVAIAALITAVANWLNTRTRQMEQGLQIAALQRLTERLATVQQIQANNAGRTIITVPTDTVPTAVVPTNPAPASTDSTTPNA